MGINSVRLAMFPNPKNLAIIKKRHNSATKFLLIMIAITDLFKNKIVDLKVFGVADYKYHISSMKIKFT